MARFLLTISPALFKVYFCEGLVELIFLILKRENWKKMDQTHDEFVERVKETIEKIRPALIMDGGDVELIEVIGKSAKVKLKGHCAHCPGAFMTLKYGIESILKQEVPGFEEVIPASDFE